MPLGNHFVSVEYKIHFWPEPLAARDGVSRVGHLILSWLVLISNNWRKYYSESRQRLFYILLFPVSLSEWGIISAGLCRCSCWQIANLPRYSGIKWLAGQGKNITNYNNNNNTIITMTVDRIRELYLSLSSWLLNTARICTYSEWVATLNGISSHISTANSNLVASISCPHSILGNSCVMVDRDHEL